MKITTFLFLAALSAQSISSEYGKKTEIPEGQMVNMAQSHLGHVYASWPTTPNQEGFLTTAIEEANIEKTHIDLAMQQSANLEWLKLHTSHVVHALDGKGQGPGLGFGLSDASKGVKKHIMLAAQSPGSSDAIQLHALHIATSAKNVTNWSKKALNIGKKLEKTNNLNEAQTYAIELQFLMNAIVSGIDANEDGVITWHEGEGGLTQAKIHMDLLKAAEGLN